MIAKTVLCASVLLLFPGPEGETQAAPKNSPQPRQQVAEKSNPQARLLARLLARLALTLRARHLDLLPIEENIVKYTNAQRAKYGLAALEIDHDLMDSARQHASWMASNRRLVHTSRPVAENIAMGQPHSLSVVRDWMNSSGHRANILNRGYRRIGVAAYRTPGGTIYWCQQFRR
jgi:uncharacterized protein YkwD